MIGETGGTLARYWTLFMHDRTFLARLLRDCSGASALEYGLLLAGLSIVIIGALQNLSLGVDAVWDTVTNNTNNAISSSSSTSGGSSSSGGGSSG
jgi:Flp pilus assembly pilin Flp